MRILKKPGCDYRVYRKVVSGRRCIERTSSRTWELIRELNGYKANSAEQMMRLIVADNGNVFFFREEFLKPKYGRMAFMERGMKKDLWDTFKAYAGLAA